jgi:hypothetical protein
MSQKRRSNLRLGSENSLSKHASTQGLMAPCRPKLYMHKKYKGEDVHNRHANCFWWSVPEIGVFTSRYVAH